MRESKSTPNFKIYSDSNEIPLKKKFTNLAIATINLSKITINTKTGNILGNIK